MKTKTILSIGLFAIFNFLVIRIDGQVVLNEVMFYPSGNQGLIIFNGNSGNEYVELYNPTCSPVNVAGYFIGSRQDFAGTISGGGFRIPNVAAANIPAFGHLVLGTSTSSSDPNSIDIKLPNYTSNYCQNDPARNFILANADGWVALYDAAGTPVDAIYWSSSAGNISSAGDYGGAPCVPTGSSGGITLESPQQINSGFPGVLTYVGNTTAVGKTYSRMPDGGSWVKDVTPSVNDLTVGNCNGGTCSSISFSLTASVVQPSCGGSGSITITPSAAGNYTYTWSPNVSTSNSASNLSANTYTITVDLNGCQKDTTITLTNGNAPSAIAVTTSNPSCGGTNGQVQLGAVTGGTAPYQYNFNGAGYSATTLYSNLSEGTYPLVVQDNNGCTYTASTIILTSASGPTAINVTPTNPSCGSTNGQVQLGAVTGGTAPYQYNFNGAGYSATTLYSNLSAGTYSLVVQDNNGCTYTSSNITLTSANGPTAINVTPTNPSCNSSDGQISLGPVTGGVAPYQFNFNGLGLSSTTVYSNLVAGSYTLVVQDNNGCSYTAPTIILSSSNGPSSIAVTMINPDCSSPSGQIQLGTVTGGTAPYQYNFNGVGYSSNTTYSNLAAGTYTLLVQDNNGCSYTAPNIQLVTPTGPTAIVVTPTNPTCGGSNGQVQLGTVTGGTAPYQFNFNGSGWSSNTLYTNLSSGTYSLVIQDNNNCSYTASNITLTTTTAPTAVQVTPINTTCGNNNGQVQIGMVTGGTAPYMYNFNGQGLSSVSNYTNLNAGTYSLTIQDNNGCVYNANTILLTNISGPTAIVTNLLGETCGSGNGEAQLGAVTGGAAPYQYNFNGQGFSTLTTYPNLNAGNYSVIVSDANNCIYNSTIAITNIAGPTDVNFTSQDASCERNNGMIVINNTIGGQAPYTYELNNSGYSSAVNYDSLQPGTYSINVQDANACIYTENVVIGNIPSPMANFYYTPSITEGGEVDITNQSSDDVISYNWSIPDANPSSSVAENTSVTFIDLSAGYYPITLIVTNQFGCVDSITKFVEFVQQPIIYVPNAFTPDGDIYNNSWQAILTGFDNENFLLRVFDRWGEMIWESKDPSLAWDGTYKGKLVQNGVYTWIINASDLVKDDVKQYKGHVYVLY